MGTRSDEAPPEERAEGAEIPLVASAQPVASIARALGGGDAEERRLATAELARTDVEAALPLLLQALGDDDWRVRKEATVVARSFAGARPLVAALLDVFARGEHVGLRNAAVEVLASAGGAATAAIVEAFPRLDADGRKLAVETLGRSREPSALAALEAALDDADDNVREAAIEAIAGLGELASDRVAEILLGRLDDRDPLVRLASLEGLTSLGIAIPWPRLAPLLHQPTLRAAALSAAALAETPEAARALADVLIQSGSHARAGREERAPAGSFDQALRALGRLAEGPLGPSIGDALRTAGPELGRRLVSASLAVRASPPEGEEATARRGMALKLAALVGAPDVVDAAVTALGEDLLADAGQRALVAIGAPGLPRMFVRVADDGVPPEARASLVDVIADVIEAGAGATHEALASLRAAAIDPERQVAVRALRAVARLGGESDLALLAEQTLAPARPIALAAEGALATLARRFPAAGRVLAVDLGGDPARALPAAILLGALASSSTFEERDASFLAHASTADDARARRAAVDAVAAVRASSGAAYPGALDVLSFALADEEHEVQVAAARALGRLCSAADPPRAGSVIDLVTRSGAVDLVAATVRAIGEGMGEATAPSDEIVSSLASSAREAASPVAIAALDALAHAERAGAPSAMLALAAAFDHPDEAVGKAAVLKLAAAAPRSIDRGAIVAALAKGLAHPSPAVRALAAQELGEVGEHGEGAG